MAIVQLKCPETGKPVDVWEYRPGDLVTADLFSRLIPCPHCGQNDQWTSSERGLAAQSIERSPRPTRVLVERTQEGSSATVLP
jgi:endogenous inhibitor of DNA gyrase (YacG/DUF329 family)